MEQEYYAIKVTRPEGLSDSQWEEFCERMDGEDFEDKCLWDAVDDITTSLNGTGGEDDQCNVAWDELNRDLINPKNDKENTQ